MLAEFDNNATFPFEDTGPVSKTSILDEVLETAAAAWISVRKLCVRICLQVRRRKRKMRLGEEVECSAPIFDDSSENKFVSSVLLFCLLLLSLFAKL